MFFSKIEIVPVLRSPTETIFSDLALKLIYEVALDKVLGIHNFAIII